VFDTKDVTKDPLNLPFIATDVPFAHRLSVVVQTSPDGVRSPDLIADAQRLLDSVASVPVEEGALKELCPACHVEVPLADVRAAICLNGHVWSTSYYHPDGDPEA
jgi:general transcription factor 3C protein 4